jgi:hypothetical protein
MSSLWRRAVGRVGDSIGTSTTGATNTTTGTTTDVETLKVAVDEKIGADLSIAVKEPESIV